MVYFGYQASKGGYQYYFSGIRGAALNQKSEVDTDTPDVPVDKDHVPEVTKTDGVEGFATKPNTEKVVMEDTPTEDGVKGTDGVEKLSKIEL